jgi:Flp pilus assembly CpaE family ATPase
VIDGPRRNGATLAALRTADRIIAVAAADPVGISRFLRGYAELRGLVGATPVTVVVNRLRAGPVGIDGRGQIRRTLERFAGIDDVLFVPFDLRAADAALREARPVAELAARSPLAQAVRRVAERIAGGRAPRQERRRAASHRRGRAGVRRERTSID